MMRFGIFVRKLAADLGVHPLQPGESMFNRRNIGIMVIFGLSFLSTTVCLLFYNDTTLDYEECFFMWITLTAVNIGYFVMILRTQKLFQLIERIELMTERRE